MKWQIEQIRKLHRDGEIRAAVIAFDPLQLGDALSDEEYERLVEEYGVHSYTLQSCYRQKENVGGVTKHVIDMIADSTPYLARGKIQRHREGHRVLTELANEIKFVNPAGYVQYYPDTQVIDIHYEVQRILQNEWTLWKHHPGLLVIEGLSDGYVLSDASNEALAPLEKRGYVKRVSLKNLWEVKGLEFQHVFVFIDKELFHEVQNGFSGSGKKIYNQRRLFRIPFSRAKDSIVTFAM